MALNVSYDQILSCKKFFMVLYLILKDANMIFYYGKSGKIKGKHFAALRSPKQDFLLGE